MFGYLGDPREIKSNCLYRFEKFCIIKVRDCTDEMDAEYQICPVYKAKTQQLLKQVRKENNPPEEYKTVTGGWAWNSD